MNITGTTRVFLILGDPVTQVRAPEVFNHLFQKHDANAVLVPAEVASQDFEAFARTAMTARNIDGFWLAIPHKPAMVNLLDRCEPTGRVAGAVNAARRNADGSLEGALFDGIGFVKALEHHGIAYQGKRVLVVGVGGGGVAIAASLAQHGVGHLALFDATPGRAQDVAGRLRDTFGTDVGTPASNDPAGYDVVVNATPLLRACHARGINAQPGFEMLIQQMPEYLDFFGFTQIADAVRADASDLRAMLMPS